MSSASLLPSICFFFHLLKSYVYIFHQDCEFVYYFSCVKFCKYRNVIYLCQIDPFSFMKYPSIFQCSKLYLSDISRVIQLSSVFAHFIFFLSFSFLTLQYLYIQGVSGEQSCLVYRWQLDEWPAPYLEGHHSEEGKNKSTQWAELYVVCSCTWVVTHSWAVANGLPIWSGRRAKENQPAKWILIWGTALKKSLWELKGACEIGQVSAHRSISFQNQKANETSSGPLGAFTWGGRLGP